MILNERQRKALAALHTIPNTTLHQDSETAAWRFWHPESYNVRLSLTCRDVMKLVAAGLLQSDPIYHTKHLFLTEAGKLLDISSGL